MKMIGNFQNVYLKASKIQMMSCKDGAAFGPKKLEPEYDKESANGYDSF